MSTVDEYHKYARDPPVGRQGSHRGAAKAVPDVGPRLDASSARARGLASPNRTEQPLCCPWRRLDRVT